MTHVTLLEKRKPDQKRRFSTFHLVVVLCLFILFFAKCIGDKEQTVVKVKSNFFKCRFQKDTCDSRCHLKAERIKSCKVSRAKKVQEYERFRYREKNVCRSKKNTKAKRVYFRL